MQCWSSGHVDLCLHFPHTLLGVFPYTQVWLSMNVLVVTGDANILENQQFSHINVVCNLLIWGVTVKTQISSALPSLYRHLCCFDFLSPVWVSASFCLMLQICLPLLPSTVLSEHFIRLCLNCKWPSSGMFCPIVSQKLSVGLGFLTVVIISAMTEALSTFETSVTFYRIRHSIPEYRLAIAFAAMRSWNLTSSRAAFCRQIVHGFYTHTWVEFPLCLIRHKSTCLGKWRCGSAHPQSRF